METKLCPKCHIDKPTSDFYKNHRRPDGLYGYCKNCFNIVNDKRRIDLKIKAVIYKGSKCVRCKISYPENPYYIFDFHHINPLIKGDWSSIRKKKWEILKIELDKCHLVCCMCHRHIQYGAPDRI